MPSMISLDGQFKADIYNQNDELVQSGEYVGNYITSTGLCYPLSMPFADTFMYLSLGSGKQENDLWTTGLYSGSKPLIYQTVPNPGHNFLWTTGIDPDSCGYKTHTSGVELFRGWRIPERDGHFLQEDLHVSELMTSPATTGGMGITGTSYPQPDGGKFDDPYHGVTAFNRVLKDFTIPSGDYAIITYKLNFVVDSEVKTFTPFIGLNNAAGAGKTTWQQLTGKARVMHPGIRLIASAEQAKEGDAEAGESYKMEYGIPMEPSASGNMYAYFSTDNTQFRFDPFWGGAAKTGLQKLVDPTNGSLHWTHTGINIATGFAEYFWNYPDIKEAKNQGGGGGGGGNSEEAKSLHDLHSSETRLKRFTKFRRKDSELPKSSNFIEEFEAGDMGNAGYNENVIVTSLNHDLSISYTGQTHHERARDMTRVMGWQTVNAIGDPGNPGTWISYKSLVFCADDDEHKTSISTLKDEQIAFFDSQFGTYDSTNHPAGGEYLVTISQTGEYPYGNNDPTPKFTQPTKDYPYHDNQNGLSMTWKLTWSAPCGEVAGGCSDDLYKTKAACQNAGGLWTDCTDP